MAVTWAPRAERLSATSTPSTTDWPLNTRGFGVPDSMSRTTAIALLIGIANAVSGLTWRKRTCAAPSVSTPITRPPPSISGPPLSATLSGPPNWISPASVFGLPPPGSVVVTVWRSAVMAP